MSDRFFKALFLCGIAFMLFSAGEITGHLGRWPDGFYADAITAAHAWKEKQVMVRHDKRIMGFSADKLKQMFPDKPAEVTFVTHDAYPGYTLYTVLMRSEIFLANIEGGIVHHWSMPFSKAFPHQDFVADPLPDISVSFSSAHLFPNGDIIGVYQALGDTPFGYGMVKLDKDSNIIWTYGANINHDLYVAENGDILTLEHHFIKEPIAGLEFLPYPVLSDSLVTLSADGKKISEIPLLEAFKDTPFLQYIHTKEVRSSKHDMLHTNYVMRLEKDMAPHFPMFKEGQLLISMRDQHMIAVVDPGTKKVIWAARGPWVMQHQAMFQPDGHISMFDNRGYNNKHGEQSRILEYDPATGGIPWAYVKDDKGDGFFTGFRGGYQLLPNGDLLINESEGGRAFEVNAQNEKVWEMNLADTREDPPVMPKAERIPVDYVKFLP